MAVQLLSDPKTDALSYVTTRNLLTSVGVAATAALTKTDVEHLLIASGVLEDISNWVLADLLVWGERQAYLKVGGPAVPTQVFWAERDLIWGEMLRFCKKNITKSACYHLRATAKAWPYERRRQHPCISFEHHRLLAGHKPEQQDYWMDVCEAGEWSAWKLRQSLDKGIDPLSPPPVVANTPHYTPLWTRAKLEDEVLYRWQDDYDEIVWDIVEFTNNIIKEYEDERRQVRGGNHAGETAW